LVIHDHFVNTYSSIVKLNPLVFFLKLLGLAKYSKSVVNCEYKSLVINF